MSTRTKKLHTLYSLNCVTTDLSRTAENTVGMPDNSNWKRIGKPRQKQLIVCEIDSLHRSNK